MKKSAVITLAIAGFMLSFASQAKDATHFKPTATIQQIMSSIVDPNIDFVWNSVATISTKSGVEEKSPHTDEEWAEVKKHALTVLEASNLLIIDGRKVAEEGANTSSAGSTELKSTDIQKLIKTHKSEFNQRALGLHDAMQLVVNAIDKKDTEELIRTGGLVDQACENCHLQFWYPIHKSK
ncbi:MAG: hypothetical protein WCJ11_05445 [Methylococcaceae bacterium]